MAKWILPLLLLVGCGQEHRSDEIVSGPNRFCEQYGCHYEIEDSETGIRVRYDNPNSRIFSIEKIKSVFLHVQTCSGFYPERGPLIIFVDQFTDNKINADLQTTKPLMGAYYKESGGIVVVMDYDMNWTLSHELLHHTLIKAAQLSGHPEPYFPDCELRPTLDANTG